MTSELQYNQHIVIFDGVCNFCNGAVNFIIKRDHSEIFIFTPMQSDIAKELMKKFQVDAVGMETFILIKNGQVFIKSDAALEICNDLSSYWRFLSVVKILPRAMRDFFYAIFAKNRYLFFGKANQCMIPTDNTRSRFLE